MSVHILASDSTIWQDIPRCWNLGSQTENRQRHAIYYRKLECNALCMYCVYSMSTSYVFLVCFCDDLMIWTLGPPCWVSEIWHYTDKPDHVLHAGVTSRGTSVKRMPCWMATLYLAASICVCPGSHLHTVTMPACPGLLKRWQSHPKSSSSMIEWPWAA